MSSKIDRLRGSDAASVGVRRRYILEQPRVVLLQLTAPRESRRAAWVVMQALSAAMGHAAGAVNTLKIRMWRSVMARPPLPKSTARRVVHDG